MDRLNSGKENELMLGDAESDVCSGCRSVGWMTLLHDMEQTDSGCYKLKASSIPLKNSSCRLCQFFGKIWDPSYSGELASEPMDTDPTPAFEIRPSAEFGTGPIFSLSLRGYYSGCMGLIRPGHLDESAPRILNPESIDYQILRGWLSACKKCHHLTCTAPMRTIGLASVLKVIDCWSGDVIPAPRACQFVALSYVWGESASIEEIDASARFPPTIEDSIVVTKKIGYRYLWIDRYCIEQANVNEKHQQLQNMDEIYSQAQLTIIAAAGGNPNYGLPGVQSRSRIPQHHVTIGNISFVQVKLPHLDVDLSPWASRAWTYQEGLLSKRKLIFTDHGVFYACQHMQAAEYITTSITIGVLATGPFSIMFGLDSGLTYDRIIENYTSRTLTYDSDALNACLGILKAHRVTHIWGIKIGYTPYAKDILLSLCFIFNRPGRRRQIFPSWSWTGGTGSVTLLTDVINGQCCKIRVGNNELDMQDVERYFQSHEPQADAGMDCAPRILELTGLAHTTLFSGEELENIIIDHSPEKTQQFWVTIPTIDLNTNVPPAHGCTDALLQSTEQLRDVTAMALWHNVDDFSMRALLLKPDGNIYRRIGMLLWDHNLHGVRLSRLWGEKAERMTVVVG